MSPKGTVGGVNYAPRWIFQGLDACSAQSVTVSASSAIGLGAKRLTFTSTRLGVGISALFAITTSGDLLPGCAYSVTAKWISITSLPPYPNDPNAPDWASAQLASIAFPGSPGAPGLVSAVPGATSGRIVMSAPLTDGQSAISHYRVKLTAQGASDLTYECGQHLTCDVTSLALDTTYQIHVQAQNVMGTSPWSQVGSLVTDRCLASPGPSVPWWSCDKHGLDLTSVSFQNANLNGINLAGANLTDVDFSGANLAGANLSGANLTNADFWYADLTGVDLTGATLTGSTGYGIVENGTARLPIDWAISDGAIGTLAAAPTVHGTVRGDRSLTIQWWRPESSLAITSFRVRSLDFANDGKQCTATGAEFSCTISELTLGADFAFEVRAFNAAGMGAAGTTGPLRVIATPGAPSGITLEPSDGSVTVGWGGSTPNGGADINMYMATATPGGGFCMTQSLSCDIVGLDNGTPYTFTVHAINEAGTGVDSVQSAAAVPYGRPERPTNVRAEVRPRSASISWTAPGDNGNEISGYVVTTLPRGAGCFTTTTTCVVTGLTPGTSYAFRVVALNEAGGSAMSARSAAVVAVDLPSAPTKVVAKPKSGKASVSWQAPASTGGLSITSYRVTVMPGNRTCTSSSLTCTVTGLAKGTAYSATVVAVNALGASVSSQAYAFKGI